MFTQSLQKLQAKTNRTASSTLVWLTSGLFAVCCGGMLLLLGFYFNLLNFFVAGGPPPEYLSLGKYLHLSSGWIEANNSSFRAVAGLLSLMLLALFGISIFFYAVSRLATNVSADRLLSQLEAIYAQMQSLIRRRSPTLLQPMVQQLVVEDVPAVREATVGWYRSGPRYFCMLVVHFAIALLIEPLLTLLSLLLVLLLRQIYVAFDRRRRRMRPVIFEQRQTALTKFSEWLGNGPLMATVHREEFGRESLQHQLNTLKSHDRALDDYFGWKSPLTLCIMGIALISVLFASAVQMLRSENTLGPIAIVVLYGAVLVSVYSFYRVRHAQAGLNGVLPNIQRLIGFLSQAAQEVRLDPNVKLPSSLRTIQLRDVTLRSHTDEVAVDSITANLHAGEITAIVSESNSAQSALADLLLGFGYPSKGECLVEGISLAKLGVDRLGEVACWVSHDGPMMAGTVEDNLRTVRTAQTNSADLTHILQMSRCDKAIAALPDGLSTLISPDDDRLKDDIPFRLGIARALTLKKPIVVLQEPNIGTDSQVEADTRTAIEQLAANGLITIVLPSRSKTLWMAQQVLFIQGGKLVAVGRHSTLLEQNDAYRHWNYMKFSPYIRHSY